MTSKIRPEISKDDVVPSLWKRYKTSTEYKQQGRIESINSAHPLVKEAEKKGLNKLINNFIGLLQNKKDLRKTYEERDKYAWFDEWMEMHKLLFKYVFKTRGEVRKQGHDVRFGAPGDEELHRIPLGGTATLIEIYEYASNIGAQLKYVDGSDIDAVCSFLARVHYGFIRIHPFGDGNGRVTRAMTDQLAISLGYPPVIAAFPRTNPYEKELYHKAITGCVGDAECKSLKSWIKNKIESSINDIA